MINLTCEHDKAKLKETKGKAGTVYICPKCNCTYRLMLVVNDKKCWLKRYPPKKQ